MRLTWSVNSLIRSFYDPHSHRLTIVSDVVDDEAEGRVYGGRLTLTVGTDGVFRDLEVVPGPVGRAGPETTVVAPIDADSPVAVWVPETEELLLEEYPGSNAITVRLLPGVPERWVQVGCSGVLVGLVDCDVLAAIRVEPEVDPDGTREAEWLDSLHA